MFWRMGDWMQCSETLCFWSHPLWLRGDVGVDDRLVFFWEFMHVLSHG